MEDGSNAVFQQTSNGTDLHYEFIGYDEKQDGEDKINLETAIKEQQNLNNMNDALKDKGAGTHCNQATQNVQRTVSSALGVNILTPGKANDAADDSLPNSPYYAMTADFAIAQEAAKNGKLVVGAFRNTRLDKKGIPCSGHLFTLSVGDNIVKGPIANIGTKPATGFVFPLGTPAANWKDAVFRKADWSTIKFYILKNTSK
ncbi:MAG: hypothetical protein H7296_02570 [Bacteroidia bacterium]|nr:hypothetical protein [Bacteroidia bacterium]